MAWITTRKASRATSVPYLEVRLSRGSPTVGECPQTAVRSLASALVQGVWRTAPETFRTKDLAESWLAATRTDLERGTWIDPHDPPESGVVEDDDLNASSGRRITEPASHENCQTESKPCPAM